MWLRPAGICFDHLLIEDALLRRALHVDDRTLTGDGDRLFERAHAQVDVDRRDERTCQLDAFAADGRESAQAEHHGIGAWPQIDDAVLTAAIGDDRTNLLNQGGARRLHRDSRQHSAGGVPDHAGNRRLRVRQRWHQGHEPETNNITRVSRNICFLHRSTLNEFPSRAESFPGRGPG